MVSEGTLAQMRKATIYPSIAKLLHTSWSIISHSNTITFTILWYNLHPLLFRNPAPTLIPLPLSTSLLMSIHVNLSFPHVLPGSRGLRKEEVNERMIRPNTLLLTPPLILAHLKQSCISSTPCTVTDVSPEAWGSTNNNIPMPWGWIPNQSSIPWKKNFR